MNIPKLTSFIRGQLKLLLMLLPMLLLGVNQGALSVSTTLVAELKKAASREG